MKILIKPRIHISLISMHDGEYRKNGGIGFSIEEPKGILNFSTSDQLTFNDSRKFPLVESEQKNLLEFLRGTQELLGLKNGLNIELEGGILTHYGMGSGTAIRLACLEALLLSNDVEPTNEHLIELSKRGGTSGIGIHTYFSGQFIFDLGIKNSGTPFQPSSKTDDPFKSMLLDAIDFPCWRIGLCIPNNIPSKSQQDENDFFDRVCPIRPQESYKTLYHSLFGVYASLKENDIESFSQSIRRIQGCEWKRLEREEYHNELIELEEKLYEFGAVCVGMSSLGPLLYFLAPDDKFQSIQDNMNSSKCSVIVTKASNSGREMVF